MSSNDGGWYYEQIDLGFNYRMTDIAAALGLSQLERLDENIDVRNRLADDYDRKPGLNVSVPQISKGVISSFHSM